VFSQRLAHASFFLHHLQKKDNRVLLMASDFNLLLVKVFENSGSKEHIDIFPKDKLKQSIRCDEAQTCSTPSHITKAVVVRAQKIL